jgi:hypothetical protein
MTRTFFAKAVAALAVLVMISHTPIFGQQPASTQNVTRPDSALSLGKLELTMSQKDPDGREFGMAVGDYWKLIAESNDGSRAYNYFRALNAEQKTPKATLLAMRASADCYYLGWLAQSNLMESFGRPRVAEIGAQARADYEQALKLDPENFSALYGYAAYEGYRPGAQAHQKELLARLDALRASRPYYPWQLVDTLEKTGKPE